MTLSYNFAMSTPPRQYWLIKSEPEAYSILQLQKDSKTYWEGIRNYQARNFMTQSMKVGDEVLFYHSNAEAPWITGIVGLAEICGPAAPDQTQFNKKSSGFDPKATKEKPIWFCVEIKFKSLFKRTITLAELKADPRLKQMAVVQRGQRLSVQPVTETDFNYISDLAKK